MAAARPQAARESIGAGFIHRQAAAGIAAGDPGLEPPVAAPRLAGPDQASRPGPPDAAIPGPVLASFAQDVLDGGLAGLSDDELVGLLCAARRMTAWQAAAELTAIAELDARRVRDATARNAAGPNSAKPNSARPNAATKPAVRASARVSEHVSAELAAALTLTGRAADGLLGLARDLARLRPVLAALAAGLIDLAKARVFAAELAALGDVQANQIASLYLDRGAGLDDQRHDARVEAWQEGSGNAALSGRELPPRRRSPPTPGSARSPAPSRPTAPPEHSTSCAPKCSWPSCWATIPGPSRSAARETRVAAGRATPAVRAVPALPALPRAASST